MSTWEERMAIRHAERAARRRAAEPPEPPEPDMPPGHEGHHWHVKGSGTICSCGELVGGVFSWTPDPRIWSDDPAEVAAVEREESDFQAWICCHICGEHGVVADDVFGIWPPRTLPTPAP